MEKVDRVRFTQSSLCVPNEPSKMWDITWMYSALTTLYYIVHIDYESRDHGTMFLRMLPGLMQKVKF